MELILILMPYLVYGIVLYRFAIAPHLINVIRDAFSRWMFPDMTTAVLLYLGATFRNPRGLLQGMAKANLSLCGERALGFFVTHGVSPNSPWEFYTYDSPYCIGLSLEILATAGVVWRDRWEPIRRLTELPPTTIQHMHVDTIRKFLHEANSLNGIRPSVAVLAILYDMERMLKADAKAEILHLRCGATVRVIRCAPSNLLCRHESPALTITGDIEGLDGRREEVHLKFRPHTTPLQHVLGFEASSVQCVITAFGAAHLYHKTAKAHRGSVWCHNHRYLDKNIATPVDIDSTESRGWSLRRPSNLSPSLRIERLSLYSKHSRFVPFQVDTKCVISDDLRHARIRALRNICWEVSEGETRFLRSEPSSLRNLLWRNHCANRSTENEKPQWLAWARDLAVRQCVALRPGEHEPVPDELSGV